MQRVNFYTPLAFWETLSFQAPQSLNVFVRARAIFRRARAANRA